MLKLLGRKITEWGYKKLYGSGIGKVPGVTELFLTIASRFFDEVIQVDGQKFRLSIAFGFEGALELHRTGRIEPHVTQLFCSLIKEGMIVVDVGASLGYYTLLAAKRVGKSGIVFAFEPYPLSYEILIKNIRMNNWRNVRTFQLAISDKEEEVMLNIPKMGQSGATFVNKGNIVRRIKVKAVPLDSFQELREADIVKIDVEGAELRVLKGMRSMLEKGEVKVICEVHPNKVSSLGDNVNEITNILKEHGYDIYLIKDGGEVAQSQILNRHAHYLFQKR